MKVFPHIPDPLRRILQSLLVGLCIAAITTAPSCSSKPPPPVVYPKYNAAEAASRLQKLHARSVKPAPKDPALANDWANFQIYVNKSRYLHRSYQPSEYMIEELSKEISKAETALESIDAGRPTPFVSGEKEEGYYCDNDGSYQPFLRYIPHEARKSPNKKRPMIVFLHGYSPWLNIVNWSYFSTSLVEFAEQEGICLVAPFARSNTDFQGIGEQDVMNAIDQMQERYSIDPDRIMLAGYSMGGMGVWTIGAHYPDRFAGLLVICARGDYYFWKNLERDAVPLHKRVLVDTDFAHALLPNLRNVPIFCLHGALDMVIPVEEMRQMVNAVRTVNPDLQYVEEPDGYHSTGYTAFKREDIRKWLLECRRRTPRDFEYKTYHPKYNRSHWISMTEFSRSSLPATVSVRQQKKQITISATGIESINVHRDRMPRKIRHLTVVGAGGLDIQYPRPGHKTLSPPRPLGPVKEAFLSPFAAVFPADTTDKTSRELMITFSKDWYRFTKAWPRVIQENAMTPKRLAQYNLFVFGNPETNPLVKRVIDASPVQVTADSFVVGERRFPRKGNGLYLVYRSPWNPDRLAVVQCGRPWGEMIPENHKFDFIPDYIVYTPDDDGDNANVALCAGFFDKNWALSPKLMYVKEIPKH